jgi:PAS domain S-box-containing protein
MRIGNQSKFEDLRDKAEKLLKENPQSISDLTNIEIKNLIHDINVYQIELEMQNDQLRNTQKDLEISRDNFSQLYNQAPVGYLTIDSNGMILQVNQTLGQMLDSTPENILKRSLGDFIIEEDRKVYYARWKSFFKHPIGKNLEFRMMSSNEKYFWAKFEGRHPYLIENELVHPVADRLFLTIADISERKFAEEKILATQKLAEEANNAKAKFLSNMSHELRTPLNAVIGFSQLLADGTEILTSNQQEAVDYILTSGHYLLDLINDVLELSKIDSDSFEVKIQNIDLMEMINEIIRIYKPIADKSNVTIINRENTNKLPKIRADKTHLKQILINLISNGVKYNRPGGTVTLTAKEISAMWMEIQVSDTGLGIKPELSDHLFEPFNRLGMEIKGIEGTGIGLSIAKKLVEQMGGKIGFSSQLNKGSLFWFRIPISRLLESAEDIKPNKKEIQTKKFSPIENNHKSFKILYIEDNSVNMILMKRVIEKIPNMEMLAAVDGNQGLKIAFEELPDLILLDLQLPDINGYDVFKAIQENPKSESIPVVALSANAMPEDIQKGMDSGFCEYLTKPIDIIKLQNMLKQIFNELKPL